MKKKLVPMIIISILCTVLFSTTVTFAALYANKVNSRNNVIIIGQTTETLVLGEGTAVGEHTAMYPGDSVSFTYTVDIEGITKDVTVAASVDQSADFTVAVVDDETSLAFAGNKVADGDVIRVTVTMNAREAAPAYSTITLTVTLTEAA